MFTGIIEEVGQVRRLLTVGHTQKLTIQCRKVLEGTCLGDSIAVNGVCLTVVEFGEDWFTADVMPETFQRTHFSSLQVGAKVNLERALAVGDRLDGHFVQGHVDGLASLVRKSPMENAVLCQFQVDPKLTHYMIPKGSIAINGISLTLVDVTDHTFSVSIIPHTWKETQFESLRVGDDVNIECDMIGKYLAKWIGKDRSQSSSSSTTLTLSDLERAGF